MTRRLMAVATALLVVGSAACSDDGAEVRTASDDTSTTTASEAEALSLAEWQRQTTIVCEEHLPGLRAVSEGLPEEASSPDGFVAMLAELNPTLERFFADLEAVGLPAARAADVRRVHEIAAAELDASRQAVAAAASGDEEGMYDALTPLEGPNQELDELLVDLGVPACATG